LPNGIHAHFSALEAIERESNRQILGQPQQHVLVDFCRRRLRCHGSERLPQRYLHVLRQTSELLLPCQLIWLTCLRRLSELRQQSQQIVHLRLAKRRKAAANAARRCRNVSGARARVSNRRTLST
jgi:hypothetical protein